MRAEVPEERPVRIRRSSPRPVRLIGLILVLAALAGDITGAAVEHTGQVTVAGTPVPGATVVVSRGDERLTTVTDERGMYRFPMLDEGDWTLRVEMLGFAAVQQNITVSNASMPASIELGILPFDELIRTVATERAEFSQPDPAGAILVQPSAGTQAETATGILDTESNAAADGFLINGSVNNSAASPFAQAAAFGNNRRNRRSLYNGGFGVVFGDSALDARPYSFARDRVPQPSYRDLQLLGTFGGPLRIPGLMRNGPNTFVGYQRLVDHAASTQSAIVPTTRERAGDFSSARDAFGRPIPIVDPSTGLPFPDGTIPPERLSLAALALLSYYPVPNVAPGAGYNYQAPLLTTTQQDNLQSRATKAVNVRNSLTGTLAFQRNDSEATSLFGFQDRSVSADLDASAIWTRRFSAFFSTRVRYQVSRASTEVTPHFAHQTDVSGLAGIAGNDRDPANWGPPSLTFSSGILPLMDAEFARTTAVTHGVLAEGFWNRSRHGLTAGAGFKRTTVDARGQQNGRGAFTFTGTQTGADVADFLLGLVDAETITIGNPRTHLSGRTYEAYIADDWRMTPSLTLNLGVRWEFDTPMTEAEGRLSNLDVGPQFSAVSIVTPSGTVGALSGRRFPSSLLDADWHGLQPRVGVAWRPVAGSSLVLRAGYGIYRNTATYQALALLMARQPPFSNALSLDASAGVPLTLADGFLVEQRGAPVTFAVDPEFRVGNAHNWQVLLQRDLPASLTVSAAYLGSHGRHLMQEFLPNTYPVGATNPCPDCPIGFAYLTSGGTSSRHAGQFQVRRRLRNGLTASVQYTLSKATDDAGAFTGATLNGVAVAQDWRDLDAERGPSNFDQRHLLNAEFQYTTGVGTRGGGLLTGLKGALIKGWTVTSQLIAGSGSPLTPTYLASVTGTGVTGSLRAALTGASISDRPAGGYLNPAAYSTPPAGEWGNAGRNSVTGPAQFSMSAGVSRTFEIGERVTLDWRIDATNVLNRVTFAAIDTVLDSPRFGAPTRANPMRKLQSTLRLRF